MIDNAWQMVTCKDCGKHYRCTPAQDYYNATTATDGVCETCLLMAANIHPDKVLAQPCPACGAPFDHPPDGRCEGHGTAKAALR